MTAKVKRSIEDRSIPAAGVETLARFADLWPDVFASEDANEAGPAQILADYIEHVIAPREMARTRRRAGDAYASARDYACHCPLAEDLAPVCQEHVRDCRFRTRNTGRIAGPGLRTATDGVRHAAFAKVFAETTARLRGEGANAFTRAEAADFVEKANFWHDRHFARRRRRSGLD